MVLQKQQQGCQLRVCCACWLIPAIDSHVSFRLAPLTLCLLPL
jgi:hypothetical protein